MEDSNNGSASSVPRVVSQGGDALTNINHDHDSLSSESPSVPHGSIRTDQHPIASQPLQQSDFNNNKVNINNMAPTSLPQDDNSKKAPQSHVPHTMTATTITETSNSHLITQPSPPCSSSKDYLEQTPSSPTISATTDDFPLPPSYGTPFSAATPSRRSKRTRTPSAKKKASLESQSRSARKTPLVSERQKTRTPSSRTPLSSSCYKSATASSTIRQKAPPLVSLNENRRVLSSISTAPNRQPLVKARPQNPLATTNKRTIPNSRSSNSILQKRSLTKHRVSKEATRPIKSTSATSRLPPMPARTKETQDTKLPTIVKQQPPSLAATPQSNNQLHHKPSPLTIQPAPSPSMSLLNADLLHTPPDGTADNAMMKDVSFEWALSETPIAYFAESPPARTPPPPKRNTRIRTPFAKAPVQDDDDDDYDSDVAPTMPRQVAKKKKKKSTSRHRSMEPTLATSLSSSAVETPIMVNQENPRPTQTPTVCAAPTPTTVASAVAKKEHPSMAPKVSTALNTTSVEVQAATSDAPSMVKPTAKPAPPKATEPTGGDSNLSTLTAPSAASNFVVEKEGPAVTDQQKSKLPVADSRTSIPPTSSSAVTTTAMDSYVLPVPPVADSTTVAASVLLTTHTKAMDSTLTEPPKPATSSTIAEGLSEQPGLTAPSDAPNEGPSEQPGLTAPSDTPYELNTMSATWDVSPEHPRKRKAPTQSTPKRRSTRRASLLSSTKIHRILVPSSSKATPLTAVPVPNDSTKMPPLCTLENAATKTTIQNFPTDQAPLSCFDVKAEDTISCIDESPAAFAPTVGTPEKKLLVQAPTLELSIKGTIDLGLDSAFSTKRKRSTRRASLSSPYRSSKYDEDDDDNMSLASAKSMASTETPMKSTIELAPETFQSSKQRKRGTRRRASMSVLGNHKLSPASSLESSPPPTEMLGSIFLEDSCDTPNTKRRRSSRRASFSSLGSTVPLSSLELVGQEKPETTQGRAAMDEVSIICVSTKPEASAETQISADNRCLDTATTKLQKSNTKKSSFKLPPLPRTLTSSKRGLARRKSFSTAAKKSSVLKIIDESGRILESIPLATPEPKLVEKLAESEKPKLQPVIPEKALAAMEVKKIGSLESTAPLVAKQSISEALNPLPVKPSHLETLNLSISIPPPIAAHQPTATKPSQPETTISKPAELKAAHSDNSPLLHPKLPSTVLEKPVVGPSPVPKAVLALRNFNAPAPQIQSAPTIQKTPSSVRRSSRRASMSASSALSRSGRKLTSSASRPCGIPGSSTKRRLLPSAEKTSTISKPGLATLTEEQQQTMHIDATTIKSCAVKLFGNNRIKSEACVSARIFASFALTHNHGNRSLGSGNVSMRVKPLVPLLTSLVNMEMTCLDERDIVTSRIRKENKRVHFSGFDCSSTKPPVEAKVGSHEHQQDCISDMMLASEQIQTLVKHSGADMENDVESSLVVRAVKSLLHFLSKMSKDTHLKRECALSIWSSYPPTRLTTALAMYKADFESILQRLLPTSTIGDGSTSTSLERRLAEFAGQSIRFHLRRLFNPPPLPYTRPADDRSEAPLPPTPKELSLRQSRVSDLVDLELPDVTRDSAIADGSISSLFSLALCRIYGYFGKDTFVSALNSDDPIRLPEHFCTSPVSQRGLGTPTHPNKTMSSEELEEMINDVDDVYDFLAAYQAINFLLQLMRAPGVKREVKKMGGWSTIEKYARVIEKQSAGATCAEDGHFAGIIYAGSMDRFFAKLEDWVSHMEPKTALAEISIKQLAKRYKTKATSPKQRRIVYRKFPHVKIIADVIDAGNARACAFPKVVPLA